ncbi:MAG: UDP-N-acetylmuramoylalanyl-D-glutamate--2,6-diaminopimelate ligase [Eggerthellaceae bacterium]|nr:UDP-N-acetylmuramoylalanyl-D-glutamate--2,6-diaminopimelate ligase [Eggerthellaceae bacterium]
MKPLISCPNCGSADFDLSAYESMIVVSQDLALFTLRCAHCGARVSSLRSIPPELREEVQFAAIEVGAGMGRNL